jgi:hypothetical protein
MASLETIEFLFGCRECILRHLRLQNFLDELPELLMFVIKQNHKTSGSRVETVRDVKDVVSSELLNTSVRDRDLVGQLVDGSAVFAGGEEVHGSCHCGCGVEVFLCRGGRR